MAVVPDAYQLLGEGEPGLLVLLLLLGNLLCTLRDGVEVSMPRPFAHLGHRFVEPQPVHVVVLCICRSVRPHTLVPQLHCFKCEESDIDAWYLHTSIDISQSGQGKLTLLHC